MSALTFEQAAVQEMREAIKASPGGEQVLARMEMEIENFIAANAKMGMTGKVYLILLALTISARAESL